MNFGTEIPKTSSSRLQFSSNASEHVREQFSLHRNQVLLALDEAHLEVHADVFIEMAGGIVLFGAIDRVRFRKPLSNTPTINLFIELWDSARGKLWFRNSRYRRGLHRPQCRWKLSSASGSRRSAGFGENSPNAAQNSASMRIYRSRLLAPQCEGSIVQHSRQR